ncbi:polyprenyl synthetase family protein [Candidatus Liberibacter solanacearum]|uniref:Probable farnesyl diphosphate synthase n=1 Tax=Candidatus Liberibacter solanacearum TaxID=556287 RepID=A0A1V2N9I7_9HYPH|nr:polyprenyl synthetase family protein [Candidatus Liberibacter solanacearum]ONI58948.1 geranyl transferase [Candidatus Liberibacter solanacearum]ONI60325.1 geranyl transferase [Candidatus Liberibacter solanacearum]
MNDDLLLKLQENSQKIESLLNDLLSHQSSYLNDRLRSAIRYAILGGKNIRSFLVAECASLFGLSNPTVLRVGAAIECVHCYSLIHDDLPSMDNGYIRRGKPTLHLQYDEATAILAGNSLLTYAFEIICSPETQLKDSIRSELTLSLARNAGIQGMLGGQMLDIQNECLDEKQLLTIQEMKTGSLMRFACEAGAIIAHTNQEEKARLRYYGENLGIVFQLVDDLLDFKEDCATIEKKSSKNATTKNNSFVKIKGQEWIKQEIDKYNKKMIKILSSHGKKAQSLIDIMHFVSSEKKKKY